MIHTHQDYWCISGLVQGDWCILKMLKLKDFIYFTRTSHQRKLCLDYKCIFLYLVKAALYEKHIVKIFSFLSGYIYSWKETLSSLLFYTLFYPWWELSLSKFLLKEITIIMMSVAIFPITTKQHSWYNYTSSTSTNWTYIYAHVHSATLYKILCLRWLQDCGLVLSETAPVQTSDIGGKTVLVLVQNLLLP